MKFEDGWWWTDHEEHMVEWIAAPKNRVILNGRAAYQGKKQIAALTLCKSFRTAVDVGGHIGLWAFNLGHRFSMVHAFEPVADHRECFARNVDMPNVQLHPFALGETPGSVRMRIDPKSTGGTYVDGDGDIPMRILDDYDFQDVDLIKLDCEGYELHALRGAKETLKKWKPVVIVEQKPGMAQKFGLKEIGGVDFLQDMGAKLRLTMAGDFFLSWD